MAGPDGSFDPLCHATKRYWVRIPVRSYESHRGCAFTVLRTVQRPGFRSAVYGTMYYKGTVKSFDKSRASVLFSVAILSWLCRKQRKAITFTGPTWPDNCSTDLQQRKVTSTCTSTIFVIIRLVLKRK